MLYTFITTPGDYNLTKINYSYLYLNIISKTKVSVELFIKRSHKKILKNLGNIRYIFFYL